MSTVSDPVVRTLLGFLLDPRFGIPFTVAAAGLVAWALWNPRGAPSSLGTRPTWRVPDADLVSRTYYALEQGEVSRLVVQAYDRYDGAVRARYGRPLNRLPVTRWGRERTGIRHAAELRKLAGQLREAYQMALDREGSFRVRWAFWRTEEEDRLRFETRVCTRLNLARRMVDWMEIGS